MIVMVEKGQTLYIHDVHVMPHSLNLQFDLSYLALRDLSYLALRKWLLQREENHTFGAKDLTLNLVFLIANF